MFGCASQSSSTSYYYRPTWTRSSEVMFIKGLQTGSLAESISTLDATGANETAWFDVTSTSAYGLSCAPTADYVAYMTGLDSGLYRQIVIRNIAAGTHSGLETEELSFSPGILAFDWSNDSTKLVYCTTNEIHTIDISGANDARLATVANLSFVSWKYGTKIVYVHTVGASKILSTIKSDGTGQVDLTAAQSVDLPQVSPANNNIIYGLSGSSFCSVDLTSPATAEIFANFGGGVASILPSTGNKAVYSKPSETTGIYILDFSTAATAETKIK